jgi:hypothetical protein
MEKLLTAVE